MPHGAHIHMHLPRQKMTKMNENQNVFKNERLTESLQFSRIAASIASFKSSSVVVPPIFNGGFDFEWNKSGLLVNIFLKIEVND